MKIPHRNRIEEVGAKESQMSSTLEMNPVATQESVVVPSSTPPTTVTKTTTMTFVKSNSSRENPLDADCAILRTQTGRDRSATRSGWLWWFEMRHWPSGSEICESAINGNWHLGGRIIMNVKFQFVSWFYLKFSHILCFILISNFHPVIWLHKLVVGDSNDLIYSRNFT